MAAIVCAWCGAHLGELPTLARISHGICPTCEAKTFPAPAPAPEAA